MGGDIETIKNRLDIADVVGQHAKLEKAGQSFKARCPFHNEKTPSFFVSPARQSYYCFGCGAKGDIFTFVQEIEGLDFKEALKILAERAGVELSHRGVDASAKRSEKEKILEILCEAQKFFQDEFANSSLAQKYVESRGITHESIKNWGLGYAPAEWRALHARLLEKGYSEELMLKAGLIKKADPKSGKSPYDVFRDRIIFPLRNVSGDIIAFSGRALSEEFSSRGVENQPKYLNSPDTVVFTKHEVLYGIDKAKEKIRRKDYVVLVEGQVDLVMSHQVGVDNAVASSGTAFTQDHLEKLKRFSKRILLAFDGDAAGEAAAEKSSILALSLGLEVKVAKLPEGQDPGNLAKFNPEKWKQILRDSKHAIEHFLGRFIESEKDPRKLGKLIERKILPMISLLEGSMERAHFVSLITKRTGIKEEVIWDDLRKNRIVLTKSSDIASQHGQTLLEKSDSLKGRKEQTQERLTEVKMWKKELKENSEELEDLEREEKELEAHLAQESLREKLESLSLELRSAESAHDDDGMKEAMKKIKKIHNEMRNLEDAVK